MALGFFLSNRGDVLKKTGTLPPCFALTASFFFHFGIREILGRSRALMFNSEQIPVRHSFIFRG